MPECKVYVGNLDPDATDRDLDKEFNRYGKIAHIWIARKPPGFAFVTFEDERDAQDACAELNGKSILSQRVRVEISQNTRGSGRGGGGGRGRGYDDKDDRYGGYGGRREDRYGGGGGRYSRSPPRRRRSESRERRPARRSPSYERGAPPPRSRSRSPPRNGGGGRSLSPR